MDYRLEKSILGAALSTEIAAQTVVARLNGSDFFLPANELIFCALEKAVLEGAPTDTLAISKQVDLDRVGGAPYLFELMQSAALPAHIDYHIQTLKDEAAKRRLLTAGQRIAQLAETPDLASALSQSQELLDSVVDVKQGEAKRIAETVDETLDRIVEIQEGTADKGLMTGFYDLDNKLGGLQAGQMVIIAARPGVGKSTLAVDIMRHLSIDRNIPTAIFSLEMSTHEINTRILSAESNVSIKALRGGTVSSLEWDKIKSTRDKLEKAPLFIDESPENTVQEIVAKTKLLTKREGIGLIVVDYLQLLRSGKREESRQQEVAGFSRTLKLLAKSAGIPVIAVAQLNRESERSDSAPKASELRESGALEQDADIILLLNREDIRHRDSEETGEVDVIIAKNRGGETGSIKLANRLYNGCFANLRR